jgi:hypothetical protein
MSTEALEQRVATIERTVNAIQQQLAALTPRPKRGLRAVIGSMADFPEFDEVMEHVRRRRDEELVAFDAAEGGS